LDFCSAVNLAVSKAGQKDVLRADCSVGHWDGSSAGHLAAQRAVTRVASWAGPTVVDSAVRSVALMVVLKVGWKAER